MPSRRSLSSDDRSFFTPIETLETRTLLASVPAGFAPDVSYGGIIGGGAAMEFAPDGRLFVITQAGAIWVVQPGGAPATSAGSIVVDSFFERGLLGIAFDPTFDASQPGADYVYLYHTVPAAQGGPFNRISRFEVTGNIVQTASPTVIFDLNPLSAGNHNGGAMHFGPDGKLYVAVGDNAVSSNSQTVNNLLGKMLRINADPLNPIPSDNPASFMVRQGGVDVSVSPTGNNRAIWAVGLRNPFTFAFQPGTGRLHINDVGQSAWEEINLGAAGANYGWPTTEGDFNQASFPNFTRPIHAYANDPSTQAVIGGAFYNPSVSQFPAENIGDYFFGDLSAGWIRRLDADSNYALKTTGGVSNGTNFVQGTAFLGAVSVGPDGGLYFLQRSSGNGGQGVRVVRTSTAAAPSVLEHPVSQTININQPVTFSVTAAGQAPLSYQWTRDGVDIAGATSDTYTIPAVTTGDNGDQFRCRITNFSGSTTSNPATLTVDPNQVPVPEIIQPKPGTLVSGGEEISFRGDANDPEDGGLPLSAYTWRVDYITGAVERPFIPEFSGTNTGSFVAHTLTPYTAADIKYRIHLTVTDSGGAKGSTFFDVLPRTANIGLATSPAGLTVNLDGQPQVTPASTLGVVGVVRYLEAISNQFSGGQWYEFVSWSDGGARVHQISTPAVDTTYTASYVVDNIAPTLTGSEFAYDGTLLPEYPHRLSFTFSESVIASLSASDLVLQNTTTGQVVPAANMDIEWDGVTNTATFVFPGYSNGILPNGKYTATLVPAGITDPPGQQLVAGTVENFFVLAGDANRDLRVDSDDFNILSVNFGTAGNAFGDGDFSYDGLVDSDDFNILATNFGIDLNNAFATQRRFGKAGKQGALALTSSRNAAVFGTDRIEFSAKDSVQELLV